MLRQCIGTGKTLVALFTLIWQLAGMNALVNVQDVCSRETLSAVLTDVLPTEAVLFVLVNHLPAYYADNVMPAAAVIGRTFSSLR